VPGTVCADDPNVRHKHVAHGNVRATADTYSVPIVKDQNVGYWKDSECQILKDAGLIVYREPENIPLGMVDA
jgi:hypothetical protein